MTASRQSPVLGVFSGTCAFQREYSGKYMQEPLGNQANFVINFCQIVFEAQTARIARGRPP
jgi:hypothetical protein